MLSSRKKWWVAAGVCAVVAIALPFLWRHFGFDLKVYRIGGSAMLTDPSTLYTARLPKSPLPFTYPPFAGLVFVPSALLPWPLAYVTSIAASVVALWTLWRVGLAKLVAGRLHPAILVAVVAGSLLIEPVRETVSYGQINLILCAVIVYDLVRANHPARGIWVGIAAGIKLTPLVFFALLLVTRQWRALAHAIAAFAGTVVIGFVVAPRTAWQYWTELLPDTGRIGALAYASNQSWNGLLIRLSGDTAGGGRLWLVLVVVTVVGALWLARALWSRGDRLASVSVCGTMALLCSPVSWSHHWVWAVPLGVALVSGTAVGRRHPIPVAATWFGLFVLAPIWWPPHGADQELTWSLAEQVVGNAYLVLALTAMALLARGCGPLRNRDGGEDRLVIGLPGRTHPAGERRARRTEDVVELQAAERRPPVAGASVRRLVALLVRGVQGHQRALRLVALGIVRR
ncbi:alpha-1,2-mannosyltransferase [Tenggerimyces flavus]|nr:alpha-1,2-mannosyltransferase [Tenggerimyces flavus]